MIKVPYKGIEIPCDTPEEAANLAKLLYGPPTGKRQTGFHSLTEIAGLAPKLSARAINFLKQLVPLQGKQIEPETLAKIFGSESVEGIGPTKGWLRRQLAEAANIDLDQILTRSPTNPVFWTVVHGGELGKLMMLMKQEQS